jgi:hypothetical protein
MSSGRETPCLLSLKQPAYLTQLSTVSMLLPRHCTWRSVMSLHVSTKKCLHFKYLTLFTPRSLCIKVTNFLLCCITLVWFSDNSPLRAETRMNIQCDIFHSRTVHLDIIKVFYLPTDAQENCFKKNIKIYIFKILLLGTWHNVFHCRPNNICSHTAELTIPMYFNWLFWQL